MKKFLLSLIFISVLGYFNQAKAQCAGANVVISNIVVTNPQLGTFNVSYRWTYVQGNASVSVVLKCGGNVVATAPCRESLGATANHVAGFFEDVNGVVLTLPDPNCAGVKEVEFRIYASSNCNGTFCPIGQNIVLPVDFKSFTATRSKSNVTVKWETSTEINNSGFAVERNTDGNWEQVAFVTTQALNGNSTSDLSYQYVDYNNTKGITQYRIKQVDFDQKSKYTEVRTVKGDGQIGKVILYPNPTATGRVNVVFDDASVLRDVNVIDMSGRTIRSFRAISNNNITIDNLTPGIYSVRIFVPETGEQAVEKIVVNQR